MNQIQRDRDEHRLKDMRRLWLLVPLLVAGCGNPFGAGAGDCTAIGALVGVSVDIEPSPAGQKAGAATLEACWAGECQTRTLELHPLATAVQETCTGDKPDDVCSARSEPTDTMNGFADIPDLPTSPVRLTLTVTDTAGVRMATQTLEVTPKTVYPNGPDCAPGGPQARLTMDSTGKLHDSTN
jgi:hypothetical protein